MTGRRKRILVIFFAVATIAVVGRLSLYTTPGDPKNIKYILWKHGLYRLDVGTATAAMIGDVNREELVVGKTKVQLRDKFGPLLTSEEVSSYLRGCYQHSYWKGRDVLFIGTSPWMVVFDGEKAADLVLIKGC